MIDTMKNQFEEIEEVLRRTKIQFNDHNHFIISFKGCNQWYVMLYATITTSNLIIVCEKLGKLDE